jgi:hypothetical protein
VAGAVNTLAQERCKVAILLRLRTLRPDAERRWGRMSVHQMVCHLADSCRMAAGEIRVAAAPSLFQRTVVKWIALFLPLPWPSGIPTKPELDQEAGGTCPSDFATDVATLEALVESMCARDARASWPAHPVFGRMSRPVWLRWAYLHMDHHLRQFGA